MCVTRCSYGGDPSDTSVRQAETMRQKTMTATRTAEINGHRGQSGTAPENTLPALLDAVSLGAHGVEFDVQLTADGRLVAMHDDTLRRTTDIHRVFPRRVNEPVSGFTTAELAKLDAGSWHGDLWAGTPIPFVADIAKAFRDRPERLCVELKSTPADPRAVATALREAMGDRPNVTVISFQRSLIDAVQYIIPGVRTALVSSRRPRSADLRTYDEFHLDASFITQRVVDRIHSVGKQVTAWTVDSPAKARKLDTMGVDAITTNRVDVVRHALYE